MVECSAGVERKRSILTDWNDGFRCALPSTPPPYTPTFPSSHHSPPLSVPPPPPLPPQPTYNHTTGPPPLPSPPLLSFPPPRPSTTATPHTTGFTPGSAVTRSRNFVPRISKLRYWSTRRRRATAAPRDPPSPRLPRRARRWPRRHRAFRKSRAARARPGSRQTPARLRRSDRLCGCAENIRRGP